MTPEQQAILNYGVLGAVFMMVLAGALITRGHRDDLKAETADAREQRDRALEVSEAQVSATNNLSQAIREQTASINQLLEIVRATRAP